MTGVVGALLASRDDGDHVRKQPFAVDEVFVWAGTTRIPVEARQCAGSSARGLVRACGWHLAIGAAVALVALFAAAPHSPAAAQTWNGNKSNDWTDPANWNGGVVPKTGQVTINKSSPNATVVGANGQIAATSGAVVVANGAGTTGSLTIQNGSDLTSSATGFSLIGVSGGTGVVAVTGPGSTWTVASGFTPVILGSGGTGSLFISGGGSANFSGDLVVGQQAGGKGTLSVTGGSTLTIGRDAYIGRFAGTQGTATISGTGSEWTIKAGLRVGNVSPGTLNIEDNAKVSVATTTMVGDFGPGTLNITSGTLETLALDRGTSSALVNFDGAILRAKDNNADFITDFVGAELNVKAGGLTIDTGGFSVGTDDTSAFTGVGGITVVGGGILTLKASNSYAGETWIQSGTLALSDDGAVGSSSRVVADGTFDISGVAPVEASIQSLAGSGSVTLGTKTLTIIAASDGFSGVISGSGGLTVGSGTQGLSGSNAYTGETSVQSGATLALLGGGTIATSSRVLADGTFDISAIAPASADIRSLAGSGDVALGDKTLTITAANDTFSGMISGNGGLTVSGGKQVLSGANDYLGDTRVTGGTLRAGAVNTFSQFSAHSVLAGGTVDLNGFDQTILSLDNAGLVRLDGAPGTTLTVINNYAGNGGTLAINTALGGDGSPTDRLFANTTSGSTKLQVNNVGGTGAQTIEGIKIVDVGGASNGAFALQGDYVFQGEQAVIGGAYAYTLHKNGVSTPTDGDWYLRSALINPPPDVPPAPLFQPGVPLYESYPQILLSLMSMPTLRERIGYDALGGRGPAPMPAAYIDEGGSYLGGPPVAGYERAPGHRDVGNAWWGRVDASRISIEPSSTASAAYDADQVRLQTGFDALIYADRAGKLLAGLTVQHGSSSARVDSVWGDGKINVEAYGIGGTLTWLGLNGFYVDTQAQVTWFDTDIRSSLAGTMTEGDDAVGYGISLETGKRFAAFGPWALTPQAQLSYTSVDLDFTDAFGAEVSTRNGDSLLGRVGIALDYRNAWLGARSNMYGIANLYYEFLDGTSIDVSGTRFVSRKDELWGGLGVGGMYSWGADKYALFGEVSVNTSLDNFGDSYSVNGTAGFRVRW